MTLNASPRIMAAEITGQTRRTQPWRRPSVLIAAFIIALIVLPSFQSLFGYQIFRFVVVSSVIWWVFINSEVRFLWARVLRPRSSVLRMYIFWFFIALCYTLIDSSNQYRNLIMGDTIKIVFSFSLIGILYLIGVVYSSEQDGRAFNWLVKFVLVAFGLNAFLAIPSLLSDDLLLRVYINIYQSTEVTKQSLSAYALGGLGLYGAQAVLAPLFLTTIFKTRGIKRLVYWALFVGIFINVFLSSLLAIFTIFIFSTIACFLGILVRLKMSTNLRIGFVAISILVIMLGIQLRETRSAQYSLARIGILFSTEDRYSRTLIEGNTLKKRQMHYERSIRTLLDFPVFGVGLSSVFRSRSDLVVSGIGGHSGILDGFAMYGLLFTTYLVFLWRRYRYLRSVLKAGDYDLWVFSYLIAFVAYFLLILVDPLLYNRTTTGLFFLLVMASATPAKFPVANSGPVHV